MWLRNLKHFKGRIFSVQIDPAEIRGIEALGVKNYLSLKEIPGPVDYVLVAVPRAVAPFIVKDCIEKKVGGAALFTSGFSETGTEEGKRLQDILENLAKQGGLNLIGPNCLGIFNPSLGLRHNADQDYVSGGNVAFVSQSGTQASLFTVMAAANGIGISKSVSYGNAIVLDSPDFLEYLARDDRTAIIGMYIEGVRDGRKLFKTLKVTTPEKPVVIWKGGRTEAGMRAIATHTASITRSPLVWQAAIKQAGAIPADNLESLVDIIKMVQQWKPLKGDRLGVIAISGGQSVAVTDAFNSLGFNIPLLTRRSYDEIASFFNIIGGNYVNPIDISWTLNSVDVLTRLLEILEADENIDAVILELPVFFLSKKEKENSSFINGLLSSLTDFKGRTSKPLIIISTSGARDAEAAEVRQRLLDKGLGSFHDFDRAASALKKVRDYYIFHDRVK